MKTNQLKMSSNRRYFANYRVIGVMESNDDVRSFSENSQIDVSVHAQ